MLDPWIGLALKAAMTVWLIAVSVWDRVERRVPNGLVLPVMLLAFAWQVYAFAASRSGGMAFAFVAWFALFTMWRAHIFGGGDAKLLMALFALFPTIQFLTLFALVVLLVSIPLMVHQYMGGGFATLTHDLGQRVRERRFLPTADDLRTRGRPHCWTLALPGVIYIWWLL